MAEVEKCGDKNRMFRSMGRMFVLCSKDELKADLSTDLGKLETEVKKATQMKEVLDAKKDTIIKQLNDLGQQHGLGPK